MVNLIFVVCAVSIDEIPDLRSSTVDAGAENAISITTDPCYTIGLTLNVRLKESWGLRCRAHLRLFVLIDSPVSSRLLSSLNETRVQAEMLAKSN
jgi:hypothetical protein